MFDDRHLQLQYLAGACFVLAGVGWISEATPGSLVPPGLAWGVMTVGFVASFLAEVVRRRRRHQRSPS